MGKDISSLGDVLKRKANDIDVSGVKDDVALIQMELDRNFSGQAKIERLDENGLATVKTRSSSMASEIRLKQYAIIQNLQKDLKNKLERFRIIIG